MTLVASVLVFLCWFAKRSSYVLFASVGYLIHTLSLDLLALGFLDSQLDFGTVVPYSFEYLYSFVVTSYALLVFTYLLKGGNDLYPKPVYSKRIVRLGFLFLSISFIALLLNLNRTGGVALMFLEPRLYELTFGESVFLNYLYFLHLPAAILFVIAYVTRRNSIFLLLALISMFFSLFHGIKFTIIHAFIYPGLILWIYLGYKFNKYIAVMIVSLVSIIIFYFNEVRGGEFVGILGYITSPSINALFLLTRDDFLINSPIGVLIPDIGFLFEKIAHRVFDIPMEKSSYDSFVLNEKYNLLPAWYTNSLLGLPSYLIVIGFFSVLISFIRRRYCPSIGRSIVEAHLYFTLLLSFTGWALFSLKIMYVMFILLLCFPLSKVKNNA